MMRRNIVPGSVAGRSIAQYAFGQPEMDTDMLDKDHLPARKQSSPTPVRVSKLPNGARIVTHNLDRPQVSLGAYVEAGAKYDPAVAPGMSYVMRWAMSGSNMENSLFQLDRNARSFGASREHGEVRKRFISLKTECGAGEHWQRLAHDIFTSISAPRFPEYDVERFRDTMDGLREELRWNEPREYAVNQLETVAFYREPLGNPRMVAPEFNAVASHAALVKQWATYCRPERVVIAAINLDHDAVVAAYENAPYPHSAEAPHHAKSTLDLPTIAEPNQYVPGNEQSEYENRPKAMGTKPDMEAEAIVAIGFPSHGAETNRKGHAATLVAREIAAMTLGESLTVNRDAPRHGIETFYRGFTNSGLFGATVRCEPGDAQKMTEEAVKAVRSINGGDLLNAAKARAVARFYNDNIDVSRDYLDFLATNLVGDTMHRVTADEVVGDISNVDGTTIKEIAESFKAARPCLFSTGEVGHLPSLRQMGL